MLKRVDRWVWGLQVVAGISILLIPMGCLSTAPKETEREQALSDYCSMEALLATPERFHGRRIQVVGYARVAYEYNVLFPLQEYDDFGISYSTVWLVFEDSLIEIENPEEFDKSYIFVEGIFDASDHGHGFSQGTIRQITRIGRRGPVHAEEDNGTPR